MSSELRTESAGRSPRYTRGLAAPVWVLLIALPTALWAGASTAAAATGGPDAFGYTLIDSRSPGGPDFAWQDIRDTGTRVPLRDFQWSAPIPVGFDFVFYGQVHRQAIVSGDGVLAFNPADLSVEVYYYWAYYSDGVHGMIYGLFTELDPGLGGSITYQTQGAAPGRAFIVQFTDVQHDNNNAGGHPVTFQFKLFEGTNHVEVHYLDVQTGGSYYLAAIRGASYPFTHMTYPAGLVYLNSNATLANLAVRYVAPAALSTQLPGRSVQQEVAPVATPPLDSRGFTLPGVTTPATCTLAVCTSGPTVQGGDAETPGLSLPRTCALVACAGPAAVPPQTVRVPDTTAPALCEAAAAACLPPLQVLEPQKLATPAVPPQQLTPAVGVRVEVEPARAALGYPVLGFAGPFEGSVPLPLAGDVPVSVCPSGCPVPEAHPSIQARARMSVHAADKAIDVPVGVGGPA